MVPLLLIVEALIILSTYKVHLDGVANKAKKCFVRAHNLSTKGADEDKLDTTV